MCYTKETPNLLRDMLNIPLLGSKKSAASHSLSFLWVLHTTGCRPASCFAAGLQGKAERCGSAAWPLHGRKPLLGQCGDVSTKLQQISRWVSASITANPQLKLMDGLDVARIFFW